MVIQISFRKYNDHYLIPCTTLVHQTTMVSSRLDNTINALLVPSCRPAIQLSAHSALDLNQCGPRSPLPNLSHQLAAERGGEVDLWRDAFAGP